MANKEPLKKIISIISILTLLVILGGCGAQHNTDNDGHQHRKVGCDS